MGLVPRFDEQNTSVWSCMVFGLRYYGEIAQPNSVNIMLIPPHIGIGLQGDGEISWDRGRNRSREKRV